MKKITDILSFRELPYPTLRSWVIGIVLYLSYVLPATMVVPTDYPNIQAGIDASASGDTVLVLDGVYSGEGNYELLIGYDVIGNLLITSLNGPENTIIDCQGQGYGIKIYGYNHLLVLNGISVINGFSEDFGGIQIMQTQDFYPVIINCIIRNNTATEYSGGGISTFLSNPIIKNCLIIENDAPLGAGIHVSNWSSPTIINSIIQDNYYADGEWLPTFTYCNLSFDFYNDELNNITADPHFINPESNNYHLHVESPCINSGDPTTGLDPDSTRIDIGPFYYQLELKGDANFDSNIDVLDIVITINVILELMETYNAQLWAMDMNNDEIIDVLDIVLVVNQILDN